MTVLCADLLIAYYMIDQKCMVLHKPHDAFYSQNMFSRSVKSRQKAMCYLNKFY